MDQTTSYFIATIILFGGPLLALFGYLKFSEIKSKLAQRQTNDKEFLEKYGQAAYNEMLKQRAQNQPFVFDSVVSGPMSGIWYSRAKPETVLQLIEINHETALIGSSPHRLDQLSITGSNAISLSGTWIYPKNPKLHTYAVLELHAKPMADGRTGVTYKYQIAPDDDPFGKQIVVITNHWLKNLVEKAI